MDAKDGLTTQAAIELLFPRSPISEPWPRKALWGFLSLLQDGDWSARGFRAPVDPKAGRETISADMWEFLTLNMFGNSASGGGFEYTGLRFSEKKKVGKSLTWEPVRRADLKRFMEKRMADLKKAGGRSSMRQDWQAAKNHFEGHSVNRDWIKALRGEIGVPQEWSKPGPRN